MARRVYKQALGLWHHPLERPLFAIAASITWWQQIYFWRPITDCSRLDIFAVPTAAWAITIPVLVRRTRLNLTSTDFLSKLFGTLLVVGLLWSLPDHVFGTGRYKFPPGHVPAPAKIIRNFPYGLVRHPAATGFLYASLDHFLPSLARLLARSLLVT